MNVKYESDVSAARLDKAILLYDGSGKFATLHDVKNNVIQPGKPLDMADMEELFRNNGSRRSGVYLPDNVLVYSQESITWYVKQTTAPIYFNATSTAGKRMNKISGKKRPLAGAALPSGKPVVAVLGDCKR